MTPTHTHVAVAERGPLPFFGGVAVRPYTQENRRAHGNVRFVETCACGWIRETLHNQGSEELSPWYESETLQAARRAREEKARALRERLGAAQALLDRGTPLMAGGTEILVAEGVRLELPAGTTAADLLRDDTEIIVRTGAPRLFPSRANATVGLLLQAASEWIGTGGPAEHVYRAIADALRSGWSPRKDGSPRKDEP